MRVKGANCVIIHYGPFASIAVTFLSYLVIHISWTLITSKSQKFAHTKKTQWASYVRLLYRANICEDNSNHIKTKFTLYMDEKCHGHKL